MELKKGDKYIPGDEPWYRVPEGNFVVLLRSSSDFEMARYRKDLDMTVIGKDKMGDTVYQVN